ncbi:MAG: 2-keto-3-deoxy-galactonokinase [Rhodospirillaceae bacterium]|nr:2-keto-3-deoxy-galactonokinase [Rhodospirillaceae bacterium]
MIRAIGCDWGTSSLRIYRLGDDGVVVDRREASCGIMAIEGDGFEAVFEEIIGDWLDAGLNAPVVLSGMIGSRQGWREAPYLECPADVGELVAAMLPVDLSRGRRVWVAPGLSHLGEGGVPDVMRGEEVQILGALESLGDTAALVCLPGTHSKWARVESGRVIEFSTYITGEIFEALRDHTILGRMMTADSWDDGAFLDGVDRSRMMGGLLNHLFGVRARGLFGELDQRSAGAYMSGLLVGHELASALSENSTAEIGLIGSGRLVEHYRAALFRAGRTCKVLAPDIVAAGHWRLAQELTQRGYC